MILFGKSDFVTGSIRFKIIPGWKRLLINSVISVGAGLLYSLALAPCNLEFLAFITLVPLLVVILQCRPAFALLYGWLWGIGWAFCSYNFLREIDPAVPFLMAPVMALWPAVWSICVNLLCRHTLIPSKVSKQGTDAVQAYLDKGIAPANMLLFAVGAAALFTLLEWTRSRLFTWNDFSVTQYRNLPLIQLASVTGSYGVGFIVALGNTAIFSLFFKRARLAAIPLVLLIIAVHVWGYLRLNAFEVSDNSKNAVIWNPILIQGDLSQRRNASIEEASEALTIYRDLTLEALKKYPDERFVIWPESAIPLPFHSSRDLRKYNLNHPYWQLCLEYQNTVRSLTTIHNCNMLIGSLDYNLPLAPKAQPDATNSALFIQSGNRIARKYDKIHRVPFGEYIPFRKVLPDFVTEYIDMGRDIVPGTNPEPIQLTDKVFAGTAVCYEGVFGYLTREYALRGANVLVVLSNDAWYPKSSEPEQHLANAVMRSVETGLPMVRCGNNGGSGVVTPTGKFTQCYSENVSRPELWRGRAITRVNVKITPDVRRTIYVKYGEFIIIFLSLVVIFWIWYAWSNQRKKWSDLTSDGDSIQ